MNNLFRLNSQEILLIFLHPKEGYAFLNMNDFSIKYIWGYKRIENILNISQIKDDEYVVTYDNRINFVRINSASSNPIIYPI